MNKQFLKYLVFSFLLVVPSLAFALPGAHEVNGGPIACNSCHVAPVSVGQLETNFDTNVCFKCHRDSGGVNTIKTFGKPNVADPYKTITLIDQGATPKSNSHKWFGTDVVPKAGAQAPTNDPRIKGLLYTGYKNTLSCGRCHSVHGTSENEESLTAPFLRADNKASDQMCRNCHAPRDVVSHTAGSHPVNVAYSSAYKNHSSSYLSSPLTNPTNPTGQVKLINGKVVCSTCHGVHNADSDSSTVDSFSTAQTTNTKGHLLRVSPYGATANATNVCTNCHTNKSAHNTTVLSGQGIQCNDCHSAHVEYDVNAPGSTPNVYLIRRYLQYSTAGRPSGRIVFDDAVNKKYYTEGGGGICQSCHNLTATHFTAGTLTRTNCAGCHSHNETTGSFRPGAGSCDSCHGYPPTSATNDAAGYTGNEATAPHIAHASGSGNYTFACAQCHNGGEGTGPTHNNSNFTDGEFVVKTAVTAGGVIAGANATYSAGKCSNIYCHSNGTSTTAVNATAITWAGGNGTITGCTACHAAVPANGNHAYHATTLASKGYGCVTCHSATVIDNSTVNVGGGKHVNAVKDVSFSSSGLAAGLAGKLSGSSCSTVYCHSDGKGHYSATAPTWGGTAACGSCHAIASTGTYLQAGSHPTHFAASVLGAVDTNCTSCHTYTTPTSATHVDGAVDLKSDGTSCATNTCHGSITKPAWGANTSNATCTKCHGTGTVTVSVANREVVAPSDAAGVGTSKVSTNAKIGAHQTHILFTNGLSSVGTKDERCQNCHGTLPTTGKHSNGSSTPAFQGIAVAGGMTSATFTAGSCSNTYCHNPAASSILTSTNTGTGVAPSWTNAAYIADGTVKTQANCGKCHKSPGDAGFPTAKYDHGVMNISNDCAGCHGHNGSGIQHIDGVLIGSSSCNTCHGYPPVVNMTGLGVAGNFKDAALATQGGGGHHTTHLLATVVQGDGFTPCLPCHPSGYHNQGGGTVAKANVNVNDAADFTFRFDSSRSKRYNSVAKTCSNVSCHFQPTPAW